jgi:hypothetical protein
MPAILNQVLVLAGVITGAVMSYLANMFTEWAKWRRSISARWDEKRLDAYADYANAVKSELRVSLRIAAGLDVGSRTVPLSLSEGLPILGEAEGRRTTLFEKLLLLGTNQTIAAAREWHTAVWELQHFFRGDSRKDGDKLSTEEKELFSTKYREVGELRDSFHLAARRDLGVSSTPLPDVRQWTRIEDAPI